MKVLKQPIKRNIMKQDRMSEWNTLDTHSKSRLQEEVYQADDYQQAAQMVNSFYHWGTIISPQAKLATYQEAKGHH